jgi:hypothetical protein
MSVGNSPLELAWVWEELNKKYEVAHSGPSHREVICVKTQRAVFRGSLEDTLMWYRKKGQELVDELEDILLKEET